MYDYLLGGAHNFRSTGTSPSRFSLLFRMRRRWRRCPKSRVVFVDIDPVAVEHSRLILEGNDLTAVVHEDIRRPERILAAPEVRRLLDLTQPVAVLMVAMLHYVSDADDPASIVSRLVGPLAAGSYLAVSHPTNDGVEDWTEVGNIAGRAGIEGTSRSREQLGALFEGLELVEPGVVWVSSWRPESPDDLFVDQPQASGRRRPPCRWARMVPWPRTPSTPAPSHERDD
jgi:hypothetical protein